MKNGEFVVLKFSYEKDALDDDGEDITALMKWDGDNFRRIFDFQFPENNFPWDQVVKGDPKKSPEEAKAQVSEKTDQEKAQLLKRNFNDLYGILIKLY